MKKYFGFWLMFEDEDQKMLDEMIFKINKEHLDCRTFKAHLSIFPSIKIDLEELKSTLRSNISFEPFPVEVKGVGMEDRWSKTLYLDIKLNEQLKSINEKLFSIFGDLLEDENTYHPHISLLYSAELSLEEKKIIAESIVAPKNLHVKDLVIVDPRVEDDNWRDYTKWNIIKI